MADAHLAQVALEQNASYRIHGIDRRFSSSPQILVCGALPHIALDGFFQSNFFAKLSVSMREVSERVGSSHSYNTDIERNKQCFSEESFDENIRSAAQQLSEGRFLAFLGSLLDVKGLIPLTRLKKLSSRIYFHVSSGGGYLGSHVDQSYVGRRFFKKYIHVCSCVFHGSPEWRSEYGGHTILFDATGQRTVTTVECKPNRTNIFLHTSTSFHGVSAITTDKKRYSL
jgi:hypothetical protein